MKLGSKIFLMACVALGLVTCAYAWLRRPIQDGELVSRAEFIVVGKIKEGSLVRSNHDSSSPFHQVELLISEVLKGQILTNSMLVTIHYGLEPKVGSHAAWDNLPKDSINIYDTGNSAVSVLPISGDIRTNQIWLLHLEHDFQGDPDLIGIYDPQDIQPLSWKAELAKLSAVIQLARPAAENAAENIGLHLSNFREPVAIQLTNRTDFNWVVSFERKPRTTAGSFSIQINDQTGKTQTNWGD